MACCIKFYTNGSWEDAPGRTLHPITNPGYKDPLEKHAGEMALLGFGGAGGAMVVRLRLVRRNSWPRARCTSR